MPVPLEQPRVKTRLNKYATPGSPIIPSFIFPYFVLFYFLFLFFFVFLSSSFPLQTKPQGEVGGGGKRLNRGTGGRENKCCQELADGQGDFFFFFF